MGTHKNVAFHHIQNSWRKYSVFNGTSRSRLIRILTHTHINWQRTSYTQARDARKSTHVSTRTYLYTKQLFTCASFDVLCSSKIKIVINGVHGKSKKLRKSCAKPKENFNTETYWWWKYFSNKKISLVIANSQHHKAEQRINEYYAHNSLSFIPKLRVHWVVRCEIIVHNSKRNSNNQCVEFIHVISIAFGVLLLCFFMFWFWGIMSYKILLNILHKV